MTNARTTKVLGAIGAAAFLFTAAGCGSTVAGGTYADNGGAAQIEFKSGGKAWVSAGPMAQACTYSESGKSVTLTCDGDNTLFSVDNDGALNGPPAGFLAHLTKKK